MPDRGLVDNVVLGVLANDAQLRALCPDGAYFDKAPAGAKAFVLVTLAAGSEVPALDSRTLYERTVYFVKSVILSSGGTQPREAAARIDALLHYAHLDLSPAGYAAMVCRRIEPIRFPEDDPADKSARWQHRGGQYELTSYPIVP